MYKFKHFFALGLLLIAFLFLALPVEAKVPTPQIYQVVPSPDNSYRPWVIGWTPNEVAVEVLIDEVAQGFAKVVKDDSGTASFGWSPQTDLPLGWHEFRVRGKFGEEYSAPGAILGFTVRPPTPPPVLSEPEQFADYILIKGLLKNDLAVKIYIDGYLAADFPVPSHPSGTTNFWFKARGLLNGLHEVYAEAYDDTGKLSKRTEVKTFKTEQQKITKGEEEIIAEDGEAKSAAVVAEVSAGSVRIVGEEETAGEVKVIEAEPEGQVKIEDSAALEQETISSIAEVDEAGLESDIESAAEAESDRERQNRVIGLIILAGMVVILFVWYGLEKKKESRRMSGRSGEKFRPDESDKDDSLGI